jgi:hypothetical protein
MPSQILHTLFGEDIIAGLHSRFGADRSLELLIKKIHDKGEPRYRGAFILGCQGPDIFYHNRRTRPVALEYGSLLHRRDYGIFCAQLLAMTLNREKDINEMTIYAVGFLTHAALDRCCHPYIVYKSTDGKNRMNHPFFERVLDVLMLKELRGQEVSSWDQGLLEKTCESPPPGLKEILAHTLSAAFPDKAGCDCKLGQRIDNTFIDCARFYRLTAPAETSITHNNKQGSSLAPFGFQALAYIFPEQLPAEIDFLNLNHNPWRYPDIPPDDKTPKDDCRSFLQIYADTVETTINTLAPCITQYLDSSFFPTAETACTIGNCGLSILNEEGKPCAPNTSDPFPLDEVLREQEKMRNEE